MKHFIVFRFKGFFKNQFVIKLDKEKREKGKEKEKQEEKEKPSKEVETKERGKGVSLTYLGKNSNSNFSFVRDFWAWASRIFILGGFRSRSDLASFGYDSRDILNEAGSGSN